MSVFGMLNWYFMWGAGQGAAAREEYAALVWEASREATSPTR